MGNTKGLFEGIMLSILFIVLASTVLVSFNSKYGQDNSLGLDTDTYMENFETAVGTAYDETTGEVTQTNDGLSLIGSWNMAKGIFDVTWGFVTGSWITPLVVDILKIEGTAGVAVSVVMRVLFSSLILFSIIKLFFKTNG